MSIEGWSTSISPRLILSFPRARNTVRLLRDQCHHSPQNQHGLLRTSESRIGPAAASWKSPHASEPAVVLGDATCSTGGPGSLSCRWTTGDFQSSPAEGVNREDASVQVAAGPNPPNFFRHPCPLEPGGNQPPRYGVGQPSLAPLYLFGSESLLSSCLARPRLLQAFHSERFCSCAEPPSGQSPSAPGSFHSTLPVWSLAGC